MSGGDLKDQLRRLHIFSEKRAQFYAAEVTLALQFLHKHETVHR
jgi:novel protein kinase C epsilon type